MRHPSYALLHAVDDIVSTASGDARPSTPHRIDHGHRFVRLAVAAPRHMPVRPHQYQGALI